jgi:predicted PhzF superfamily epimerase YddE/YHI9
MRLPIYQVDAFTDRLFGGNPAAVCPLHAWLPDETMQAIAAENNLAETAFFVRCAGSRRRSKSTCAGMRRSPPATSSFASSSRGATA